jgi:hypothetical protein
LLYRWHTTLSEQETAWAEGVLKQAFGDKPYEQVRLLTSPLGDSRGTQADESLYGGRSPKRNLEAALGTYILPSTPIPRLALSLGTSLLASLSTLPLTPLPLHLK